MAGKRPLKIYRSTILNILDRQFVMSKGFYYFSNELNYCEAAKLKLKSKGVNRYNISSLSFLVLFYTSVYFKFEITSIYY